MALRCPECRGFGTGYTLAPWEAAVYRYFGPGDIIPCEDQRSITRVSCPVCHGTGWRIPPALPEKVKQRRERMNHENRTDLPEVRLHQHRQLGGN